MGAYENAWKIKASPQQPNSPLDIIHGNINGKPLTQSDCQKQRVFINLIINSWCSLFTEKALRIELKINLLHQGHCIESLKGRRTKILIFFKNKIFYQNVYEQLLV